MGETSQVAAGTQEAVFLPESETTFIATEHAAGPWSPHHQHGGAPAALLTRAIERVETLHPMVVSRLTLEILRPVPLGKLRVESSIIRPGKKVQLAEARLYAGEQEVARATAARIRAADVAAPEIVADLPVPPAPEAVTRQSRGPGVRAKERTDFVTGFDLRVVEGDFDTTGPAKIWFRLNRPIVAGEEPSPLMRVAASADFGNGVGAVLEWSRWTFMNVDLTIYLHRQPAGEWILLDSATATHPHGYGVAETRLADSRGPIGRSLQSLIIEPR